MSDQFLDVDDEPPVEEVGIESILNQVLDLMATAKSMPKNSLGLASRQYSRHSLPLLRMPHRKASVSCR